MIGDQQQLRSRTSSNSVAENASFDRSLFERMFFVTGGIVLSDQRRMSPKISELITPTTYSNLTRGSSTLGRENIKGIRKNVFFLDHKFPETQDDSRSYYNEEVITKIG